MLLLCAFVSFLNDSISKRVFITKMNSHQQLLGCCKMGACVQSNEAQHQPFMTKKTDYWLLCETSLSNTN